MENVQIKRVKLSDLPILQSIARLTFIESFSGQNDPEDMRVYIDENLSIQKLKSELNNPESRFYFAQYENKVIGYLKINYGRAQTEQLDSNSFEIERIYVRKEFHGNNVGQLLFNRAIQIAKLNKSKLVWLGVWEKNLRAIRFYEKNGFVAFDKHIFKLGDDAQTDIMMRLELISD